MRNKRLAFKGSKAIKRWLNLYSRGLDIFPSVSARLDSALETGIVINVCRMQLVPETAHSVQIFKGLEGVREK